MAHPPKANPPINRAFLPVRTNLDGDPALVRREHDLFDRVVRRSPIPGLADECVQVDLTDQLRSRSAVQGFQDEEDEPRCELKESIVRHVTNLLSERRI